MPPRIRSSIVSLPTSSCSSFCTQPISLPARTAREFSQSSCRQVTARRRAFYAWLNGPGRALKQPLPNSTNYLGAYDRYGNLQRGTISVSKKKSSSKSAKESGEESTETVDGEEKTPQGQEVDELDMAARRHETETGAEEERLAPETLEDLRPYPANKFFRSQPVLSEDLREAIYQRVVKDEWTVPMASVTFGVSNERVGAVVRLKQMEKQWIAQGKVLATPYSKAVLEMLPTTPYIDQALPQNKNKRPIIHESINDLIVHPATRQQLFVPVAESRVFTRADAGKAFDNKLLPADDRIPHPDLVHAERDQVAGLPFQERQKRATERYEEGVLRKQRAEEARKLAEERSLTNVRGRRWDFVFQDVSVESAGRSGRDPRGVGWRYGVPHQDRKKGQVKIPTRVEA